VAEEDDDEIHDLEDFSTRNIQVKKKFQEERKVFGLRLTRSKTINNISRFAEPSRKIEIKDVSDSSRSKSKL
jgi:hypothetical protein